MNLTMLLIIGGVAALALVLRMTSGDRGEKTLPGPLPGAPEAEPATDMPPIGEEPEDEGDPDEVAVIGSNGLMFLPFNDGVQLLAGATPDQAEEEELTGAIARGRVVGMLTAGDLLAARLMRGAPGVDPWRLEAIGREREYLAWSFETEGAGRAALEMLERRVARAPLNEDGEPEPPAAAQFEEARRINEETARELAMASDEPEPDEEKG
jgi:hypothetical protein